MIRAPAFLLLFAFMSPAVLAAPGTRTLDHCAPGYDLVLRTGKETCWARISVDERTNLCLSRRIWKKWLERPSSLCGRWTGRWKSWSPQINDPRVRPAERKELKRPRWEFRVQSLPEASGSPGWTERARWNLERIREELARRLVPHDRSAVLRRLLVDERAPGSPERLLRVLGFVHLVSATGIHLYAMARLSDRLVYAAAGGVGVPWGWARILSGVTAFVLWLSAWLLEGARPGMIRPWIVVVLRSLARFLGIRWRLFAPLSVALLIDLTIGVVRWLSGVSGAWAPGRLHYVLAVGGGLLAMELSERRFFPGWPGRPGRKSRSPRRRSGSRLSVAGSHVRTAFREHFALSVGSWLFTAVLDAWEVSLVATFTPLLSLLTIPFFASFVYPLLLVSSAWSFTGLADEVFRFCALTSDWLVTGLGIASMRLSSLWVMPPWALAWGVAAAVLFGMRGRRAVSASIIASITVRILVAGADAGIAAFSPKREVRPVRAVRIEQLDVGQGDAALVVSDDGRAGLIDTGAGYALSPDRWIGLFAARSITRLDFVALSHLDEDHAGALERLTRLMPIDCVVSAEEQWNAPKGALLAESLRSAGVAVHDWRGGRGRGGGCFPFSVLPPSRGGSPARNGAMSVFLVPMNDGRYFFSTGDVEGEEELRAAQWAHARIPRGAGVLLKVSHHGSRFSTPASVLRRIRPEEAWISAGAGNFYGHPTAEVIQRLNRFGIVVRRTDREGSLSAVSRGWLLR